VVWCALASSQFDDMLQTETPIRPRVRNANQHPDTNNRSSRTVGRSFDADYDTIPPPPSKAPSRRPSSVHGASSSALPDDDDLGLEYDDSGYVYGDDDEQGPSAYTHADHATPSRPISSTPRRRSSFSQNNQDAEEQEEEDDEAQRRARSIAKGKGKGVQRYPDYEQQNIEDDIARGLAEIDNMDVDGDVTPQPETPPPPKKVRPPKRIVERAPELTGMSTGV
jgi:centromere protein C